MTAQITRYFVTGNGTYIGGYEGAEPPTGAIEVPTAPQDARQIWDGVAWGPIPPTPILSVTPRQFRLALNATGMRASIEAYVAAGSQDMKDTWEFATVIERNSPIIAAGAAELGLTEGQIDDLFSLAATL